MQSEYSVKYGESLIDVIMNTYGDLNQAFRLIQDNDIENLDIDLNDFPDINIEYEIIPKVPADLKVNSSLDTNTTLTLKAINRQSLFDIALMTYGKIDNIFLLIQDNGVANLNDAAIDQVIFSFDSTLISDYFVYLRNRNNNIRYGTAEIDVLPGGALETASDEPLQTADGIQIIIA